MCVYTSVCRDTRYYIVVYVLCVLYLSSMTGGEEMEEEMTVTTVGAAGTLTIVVSLALVLVQHGGGLEVHDTKWHNLLANRLAIP